MKKMVLAYICVAGTLLCGCSQPPVKTTEDPNVADKKETEKMVSLP